jgi:hypothetical protein
MADNTKSVTVTNATTEIVGLNQNRKVLVLFNNGSVTVFLGFSSTDCTVATSLPLKANSYFTFHLKADPIWGITASGSSDIRVWEDERV